MASDDHAVVVGITRYPGLNTLEGPERDANAFRDWLVRPQGGAVLPDHVQLILSSNYTAAARVTDEHPEPADVVRALEHLMDAGEQLGGRAGRRLYLYLAGHGFSPGTSVHDAALLMANAVLRRPRNVPGRPIVEHLKAGAYFDEVVLVMDCCRDSYPSAHHEMPTWEPKVRPEGALVRYLYAFATQWSRKAREGPVAQDGFHRGYFTSALLDVLGGGRMSGTKLKKIVINHFKERFTDAGRQEPEILVDDQRDLVFNEAAPDARFPVRVTFRDPQEHVDVQLRNDKFQVVTTFHVPDGPWDLQLEPGLWEVRIPGTRRECTFEVNGVERHVSF
mgnify:CR=1 FL=1